MKSFKLLSFAVFAILAFTITSCNPDETPEPTDPNFTVTEINFAGSGFAVDSEILAKVYVENNNMFCLYGPLPHENMATFSRKQS